MTSLTRITDHVHHISDVVVGLAMGAGVAVWAVGLALEDEDSRGFDEHLQEETAKLEMSVKSNAASSESTVDYKSVGVRSNHVGDGRTAQQEKAED